MEVGIVQPGAVMEMAQGGGGVSITRTHSPSPGPQCPLAAEDFCRSVECSLDAVGLLHEGVL